MVNRKKEIRDKKKEKNEGGAFCLFALYRLVTPYLKLSKYDFYINIFVIR